MNSSIELNVGLNIIIVLTILFIVYIIYLIFKSPFKYPYFKYTFNVTGKRKPDIENLIDTLINEGKFSIIKNHEEEIKKWKKECEQQIKKKILKKYRKKQYTKAIDDDKAYIFNIMREQTRYRQINYEKESYKVEQVVGVHTYGYQYLYNRYQELKKINFECTLKEYYSENQRKAMTSELRNEIKVRDNYTCQKCGKHMPDEVGLHIDHIIPISKGGKSVPSNLQVLCSKCNGKKSNK